MILAPNFCHMLFLFCLARVLINWPNRFEIFSRNFFDFSHARIEYLSAILAYAFPLSKSRGKNLTHALRHAAREVPQSISRGVLEGPFSHSQGPHLEAPLGAVL